MNVFEVVKDSIKKLLDHEEVINSTRLKDDLGFDSLTLVTLIIDIEEATGIEFDSSSLEPEKIVTVGDVVELLKNRITI